MRPLMYHRVPEPVLPNRPATRCDAHRLSPVTRVWWHRQGPPLVGSMKHPMTDVADTAEQIRLNARRSSFSHNSRWRFFPHHEPDCCHRFPYPDDNPRPRARFLQIRRRQVTCCRSRAERESASARPAMPVLPSAVVQVLPTLTESVLVPSTVTSGTSDHHRNSATVADRTRLSVVSVAGEVPATELQPVPAERWQHPAGWLVLLVAEVIECPSIPCRRIVAINCCRCSATGVQTDWWFSTAFLGMLPFLDRPETWRSNSGQWKFRQSRSGHSADFLMTGSC